MTSLHLIAVKSRGEASFEIAEKHPCPECAALHDKADPGMEVYCPECDSLGFWWITNHGYRAHPFRTWDLDDLYDGSDYDAPKPISMLDTMPDDAIDLFPAKQSKSIVSSGKSLLAALGLLPKVVRRL